MNKLHKKVKNKIVAYMYTHVFINYISEYFTKTILIDELNPTLPHEMRKSLMNSSS